MLVLTENAASETILVTLNEKKTLNAPYILFIFTNVETKEQVTKIFAPGDDSSLYPARYNKFTVQTVTLFADKKPGFWNYAAYEQPAGVNTNPANATTLLELGKLRLDRETTFAMTEYNEGQTYKEYDGQ